MQGKCTASCQGQDGALFCDGSYVDVGNSLSNCETALKNALNIQVQGSASCQGNTCQAQASASCGGHIAPVADSQWQIALGMLGVLGAVSALRRRRNRK